MEPKENSSFSELLFDKIIDFLTVSATMIALGGYFYLLKNLLF